MTHSPGHRKWPAHQVRERQVPQRVVAEVNGEVLADSTDVIKVEEDQHRDRYYFPRNDVKTDKLRNTQTTSECPFKGLASYFSIVSEGRELSDAAWSYEDPYEEHSSLKGRICFYDDKFAEIEVRTAS